MSLKKTLAMLAAAGLMCFGAKAEAKKFHPGDIEVGVTMMPNRDLYVKVKKHKGKHHEEDQLHPISAGISAVTGIAAGLWLFPNKKKRR